MASVNVPQPHHNRASSVYCRRACAVLASACSSSLFICSFAHFAAVFAWPYCIPGDYFVVQIFTDPVYHTPVFYTNGGASSCHWEVGTAHRSALTLKWKYIGADVLTPDQPAIFKVTLANELGYYEEGMRGNVDRPNWALQEIGYVASNPELYVMSESIHDGLRVFVNGWPMASDGIMFFEFTKSSVDVLAEIHRGPIEYTYPCPIFGWKDPCGGIGLDAAGGENKYGHTNIDSATGEPFYALSMPVGQGQTSGIRFMEPCSPVTWSGAMQRDQGFVINLNPSGPTAAKFMVANPGPRSWDDDQRLEKLVFQYRPAGCLGYTCWKDGAMDLPHGGASLIGFEWAFPSFDGIYDVRVATHCTPSSQPAYDESSTTIVPVIIDRSAPAIISTDAHQSGGRQIIATAVFSENIVCNQKFDVKFEFASAGVQLSASRGQLKIQCNTKSIVASCSSYAAPSSVFTLTIVGVEDTVGNTANEVSASATIDYTAKNIQGMPCTLRSFKAHLNIAKPHDLVVNASLATFARSLRRWCRQRQR